MTTTHFVSAACNGEVCRCGLPATHKTCEVIAHDDPNKNRHELCAYVCCAHFLALVGPAAPCEIRPSSDLLAGQLRESAYNAFHRATADQTDPDQGPLLWETNSTELDYLEWGELFDLDP